SPLLSSTSLSTSSMPGSTRAFATHEAKTMSAVEATAATRPRRTITSWDLLLHDPIALLAVAFLVVATVAAVFADQLVQFGLLIDPLSQNLLGRNRPPMYESKLGLHLLGTDQLGRDLLARLIYGARISLGVGVVTVIISSIIGVTLGLIA